MVSKKRKQHNTKEVTLSSAIDILNDKIKKRLTDVKSDKAHLEVLERVVAKLILRELKEMLD